MKPIAGGTFTEVKASYRSVVGEISVEWHIEGDRFFLTVNSPEGIPAQIILPDGSEYISHGEMRHLDSEYVAVLEH